MGDTSNIDPKLLERAINWDIAHKIEAHRQSGSHYPLDALEASIRAAYKLTRPESLRALIADYQRANPEITDGAATLQPAPMSRCASR